MGGVGGSWANSPLLLMAFGMMGTPNGWAESIHSGSQVTTVYVGFLVDCYQRGFYAELGSAKAPSAGCEVGPLDYLCADARTFGGGWVSAPPSGSRQEPV